MTSFRDVQPLLVLEKSIEEHIREMHATKSNTLPGISIFNEYRNLAIPQPNQSLHLQK